MEKNNAYLEEVCCYNLDVSCAVFNFLIHILRRIITNEPFAVRQVNEGDASYICIYEWRN